MGVVDGNLRACVCLCLSQFRILELDRISLGKQKRAQVLTTSAFPTATERPIIMIRTAPTRNFLKNYHLPFFSFFFSFFFFFFFFFFFNQTKKQTNKVLNKQTNKPKTNTYVFWIICVSLSSYTYMYFLTSRI